MQAERLDSRLVLGGVVLALGLGLALGRLSAGTSVASATPLATAVATESAQPDARVTLGKRYNVPVSKSQPQQGPADALVTIVQWCDFPDPGCAALEPRLQELSKTHSEMVRLVFRHFARPNHPGSAIAHQFARAAHQQAGKFWQARALLLPHPDELTLADLERYSGQLGLNWETVRTAIEHHDFISAITADHLFSTMFDVHDSPAVFINGRSLGDHPTPELLVRVFDEELRHAVDLIAGGVQKADLYAELVKKGAWSPARLKEP